VNSWTREVYICIENVELVPLFHFFSFFGSFRFFFPFPIALSTSNCFFVDKLQVLSWLQRNPTLRVFMSSQTETLKKSDSSSDDLVWNFAYGANMNPKALIRKRKIRPTKSCPAVLSDYTLAFNCMLPF